MTTVIGTESKQKEDQSFEERYREKTYTRFESLIWKKKSVPPWLERGNSQVYESFNDDAFVIVVGFSGL